MSNQWGGKRANSGRHSVAQKVKHIRLPVLAPRNIEEELAMNWFRSLKPEQRLRFITKKGQNET